MKNKLIIVMIVASAVSAVVAIGALCGLGYMYSKVRAYERAASEGGDSSSAADAAGTPRLQAAGTPRLQAAGTSRLQATNAAAQAALTVTDIEYDEETTLRVKLSARPDMKGIRSYVSVSPMNSGFIGISYEADYSYRKRVYEPTLVITGDFAFRTNVTLRIRKGLAPYGKGDNPAPEGALAADWEYTFERKDLDPDVAFAADGRYLPPCGTRRIGIESVNVKSVQTEVRRVEPRNIVQLLAREERKYDRYYGGGGDSKDTRELSGELTRHRVDCANRVNRKETSWLPVACRDGGSSNGVFLVVAGNGEKPFCEHEGDYVRGENGNWVWKADPAYNEPSAYRLVCVSDLGVSVRRSAAGYGVWVTSLTTGRPVPAAIVEVYSAANTRVLEGRTDAHGWCATTRIAEGDPFAVVVRTPEAVPGGRMSAKCASDMTFLALSSRLGVDETYAGGARAAFLKPGEVTGYAWTERGIYRHDEKIFYQLLLRDGEMKAPAPLPVTLRLQDTDGRVFATKTLLSDKLGALTYEGFAVPAEQPSGTWMIQARLPGEKGAVLAERAFRVEEFAPPQIRVKVAAAERVHPTNFAFTVTAEHLFGGAASDLRCEGAVVFEDVPFAPAAWKGYRFGDEDRGLRPSYRELDDQTLGADGRIRFAAPLWSDSGRPNAMIRATGQGRVIEDGGRAATARASAILHYYPYYLGSTMSDWVRKPKDGVTRLALACVAPDGKRLTEEKRLTVRLERIDSVYTYRENGNGWNTWDCERIRNLVAEDAEIVTSAQGDTSVTLPISASGDYAVTIADPATGVSYSHTFYLSDWGDEAVRAPLANPTEVSLRCDKAAYRVGETPKLVVKSPFAGWAMVSVQRETERYTEILELTNATSVVELRPVVRADAPNLDVYISVVQSVEKNAKHLAVRAHGQTTVKVMPAEHEIAVAVAAEVRGEKVKGKGQGQEKVKGEGQGQRWKVDSIVDAKGAEAVWVTVVDEGINILTGEPTPDPIAGFAKLRGAAHPLYDIYSKVLPVEDAALGRNGVKTGGGFGAEMLGRVSPVGTRRFKPLAKWTAATRGADGRWHASIELPPFVGEVRVTAVAHSATASGAASVQQKVAPKIVMQPDAPRFAAPGDVFEATLPLRNRSGAACVVRYEIRTDGTERALSGQVELPKDGATNLFARLTAPRKTGDLPIVFRVAGAGETHEETILLPVRPAVAWVEQCGVRKVGAAHFTEMRPRETGPADKSRGCISAKCTDGETESADKSRGCISAKCTEGEKSNVRYTERVFDSPVGEYAAALDWLAEYRHGCLEQTCSRVFPLVASGAVFTNLLSGANGTRAAVREEAVARGVARVVSMMRKNDFVMWPDCDCPPWNREVALYAAHFLVAANRAGESVPPAALARIREFLSKWILSKDADQAAYAALVWTLFERKGGDRLYRLYDDRAKLSALARSRLALAFAELGDFARAKALLKDAYEPQSVKEAAFQLMARTAVDPQDARLLPLVAWLNAKRGREKLSWGTTEENAHALLAIGAYYRANPPQPGEKYVAWRKLTLPKPEEVKDESNGLFIARRLRKPDGADADPLALRRGQLLYCELTVTSDVTRVVHDLVIEDLFAGAFDPIHAAGALPSFEQPTNLLFATGWLMRSDIRDDRALVFSKEFKLEAGHAAQFTYPVRVVSEGDFVLPGPSVEGMYNPDLHARRAPGRLVVRP